MQRNTEPKDEDMCEALEALHAWEQSALPEETLVCECYCVSVLDIKQACKGSRSVDVELLRQSFGLGTGCGQCMKDIAKWKSFIF